MLAMDGRTFCFGSSGLDRVCRSHSGVFGGTGTRGTEERYCRRIGYDPALLQWYHGLEYLDTWRWVLSSGEGFVHHTAQSLEANLKQWLLDVRQ